MAIAEDLDTAFAQYVARSNAQGYMLRRLAGNFSDGFAAYVGAVPNVWNKEDGKVGGPRVRLGEGDAESFKPVPWAHIRTALGLVNFSISYTLSAREEGANYSIVCQLCAQVVEDGYRISIAHHDREYWVSPSEDVPNRFDSVYAGMVEMIKRRMNPESILLHKVKDSA